MLYRILVRDGKRVISTQKGGTLRAVAELLFGLTAEEYERDGYVVEFVSADIYGATRGEQTLTIELVTLPDSALELRNAVLAVSGDDGDTEPVTTIGAL